MSDEAEREINTRVNELLPGIRDELRDEPIYNAIISMSSAPETALNADDISNNFGDMIFESLPEGVVAEEGGVPGTSPAKAKREIEDMLPVSVK